MTSILKMFKPDPYIEEIQDEAKVKELYGYWRIRILYSMFIGYALYYFTRKSFVFAIPGLIEEFGFTKEEIGTRSIRSGAAMSLAVQGGHTDEKIRILGRWKSLAFLTYIRPQVLEWSGGMAEDMAKTKSFTDVSEPKKKDTDQKSPATRPPPNPSERAEESFPRFQNFDSM